MSQEDIFRIIVTEGPIDAITIRTRLRDKGIEINEKSFYAALNKVEKDDEIKVEKQAFFRIKAGRQLKFYREVWKYEPNTNSAD